MNMRPSTNGSIAWSNIDATLVVASIERTAPNRYLLSIKLANPANNEDGRLNGNLINLKNSNRNTNIVNSTTKSNVEFKLLVKFMNQGYGKMFLMIFRKARNGK